MIYQNNQYIVKTLAEENFMGVLVLYMLEPSNFFYV